MKSILQSVFAPRAFAADTRAFAFVMRWGWVFILLRWGYYSVVFRFRDYHGSWAPFWPPPFGLDVDAYARLQRDLALPFGIVLMLAMSLALVAYLRLIRRRVPFPTVVNILGVTFFLPFVLLQPIDAVFVAMDGWRLVPVTVVHTAVLVWESWAALEVISATQQLGRAQRVSGIVVLCAVWILLAGQVWR